MSSQDRFKKIDAQPLGGDHVEHYWVETLDEALESYVDGDMVELSEGRHVVSGRHKIFGSLTVRGTATSNWKTLVVNRFDSEHFIWCVGKHSRVTFENVLIRGCGARMFVFNLYTHRVRVSGTLLHRVCLL